MLQITSKYKIYFFLTNNLYSSASFQYVHEYLVLNTAIDTAIPKWVVRILHDIPRNSFWKFGAKHEISKKIKKAFKKNKFMYHHVCR